MSKIRGLGAKYQDNCSLGQIPERPEGLQVGYGGDPEVQDNY